MLQVADQAARSTQGRYRSRASRTVQTRLRIKLHWESSRTKDLQVPHLDIDDPITHGDHVIVFF